MTVPSFWRVICVAAAIGAVTIAGLSYAGPRSGGLGGHHVPRGRRRDPKDTDPYKVSN